jgi:hypothetical protein
VINLLESLILSLLKSCTSFVKLNVAGVLGNCKVSVSLLLRNWAMYMLVHGYYLL